ncbi:MAG: TonB-dependent receptor [Deinococcales bacterium]|nr:TonB-dependent receptor [Chitinophagaceae bacterium]
MSKKLTLLSTALFTTTLLLAQQDTLSTKNLDEVIVTANKVAQKQSTTGKVVTVITKEQLEKSTGKTVAQILNEQVGITINGSLNNLGTNQSVFVRGAGNGKTLLLLDGIPVNDPSQIAGDFDLNLFSINDVERIEICKGAQSTLYGSDAIAGVINIITVKKDITKPFNLKAAISAGNRNTAKQSLQLYGKAGKFTYATRFSKLKTDGFSAAYDSSAKGRNFDNDGYDGTATNGSLVYQATKDVSLKAFTQFSQYTAGIDAGVFADKRNYTTFSKSHISGLGVVVNKEKFSIIGNYQYTKANRVIDDNASIPGATSFSLNQFTSTAQFAELYTSIKLGNGFTLLAGSDYRFGSFFSSFNSLSQFGPYNAKFADTAVNQIAAYTSLAYNSRHLNIEFGGRYNKHSRYGDNYTYSFNPSYIINDNYRVFGSIATGFKAPTLYQLFAGPGIGGNVNLRPEKSINYEIGVQQQSAIFKNRVVFFYRDITDGIDYSSIATNGYPTGYFNFASQVVRGLEYEVSINPTKKLNITGNYTYLVGEEATQSRVNFKDTAYSYLLRRPKHNLNITAGYQFTKGLYASITGKYVSSRQDVGGYKKTDIGLDSYTIVGAYAEYTCSSNFKFFADVQNLTNKKFYDVRGFNSQPLLFNAGVTITW